MKQIALRSGMIAALLLVAGSVHASGIRRNVFHCETTDDRPSYSLDHVSQAAPGGPVIESYELHRGDMSGAQQFRLVISDQIVDGSTRLTRFRSGEPNGYGTFDLLTIGERTFISADMRNTFGGVDLSTSGLIELGDGYVCEFPAAANGS
jgi:hypothetical protein